jgi:hypothetical protein
MINGVVITPIYGIATLHFVPLAMTERDECVTPIKGILPIGRMTALYNVFYSNLWDPDAPFHFARDDGKNKSFSDASFDSRTQHDN